MSSDLHTAVDQYLSDLFIPADAVLDEALRESSAAELPAIAVSPNQGKFLFLLARAMNATRILEIGTLGGYSAIWLARALPEQGKLITLEFEPRHAQVAQKNIQRAGLADRVEIRIGAAVDSLRQMIQNGEAPFDLIFIDADKEGYPQYLELTLQLSRSGTTILADNVVREGEVINPASEDSRVQGVREFCRLLARQPNVEATALQTVGSKGYDGFAMVVVK